MYYEHRRPRGGSGTIIILSNLHGPPCPGEALRRVPLVYTKIFMEKCSVPQMLLFLVSDVL
jgi:hypothetical protein